MIIIFFVLLIGVVVLLCCKTDNNGFEYLEEEYEMRLFLMPREEFEKELSLRNYFDSSSSRKSKIIYDLAKYYSTEPSQIIARINELGL